jgi:hypothetical protein
MESLDFSRGDGFLLERASRMSRTTRQHIFNPRKLVVTRSAAPHRKPPKKKTPYELRIP